MTLNWFVNIHAGDDRRAVVNDAWLDNDPAWWLEDCEGEWGGCTNANGHRWVCRDDDGEISGADGNG